MADKKISQFDNGGAIQTTDEIATNRGGVNTKVFVGSAAALNTGNGPGDIPTNADLVTQFAEIGKVKASPSDTIPSELIDKLIAGSNVSINLDVDSSGNEYLVINASAGATSLPDGDYGDITVSGSGSVFTIKSDVVTFSKIQNVATRTIAGRTTAGTGDLEQIPFIDDDSFATATANNVPSAESIKAYTGAFTSFGGCNFDGSTDYLDSSPLTGIADGKKFTVVAVVRFANAASASEVVIESTSNAFSVYRFPDGDIRIRAENAGGAEIVSVLTNNTPCAAAGTYVIMISGDTNVSGSTQIYVNGVDCPLDVVTFTNDTIDYTVAEYSIGANVAGSTQFSGDMYSIWFSAVDALDFDSQSVRRRFVTDNNTPIYLGANGELPTGTSPILFLGYDKGVLWAVNKGTGTGAFTVNGTPVAAVTPIDGELPFSGTYTPTLFNTTNMAASTAHVCQWGRSGNFITVSGRVDIDPTANSVSTVLGMSLPFASDFSSAVNLGGTGFSVSVFGLGGAFRADATNKRAALEFIAAASNANTTWYFNFSYRIIE